MIEVAKVIWDNVRRKDSSIDLRRAALQTGCKVSEGAYRYLEFVESIRPVKSRQVAALSIATAMALYPVEIDARHGGRPMTLRECMEAEEPSAPQEEHT